MQQTLIVDGSEGEKRKSEICLCHQRLGHVSFGYLKKLFPSLFAKFDISNFRCDVYELAKSHCVSFQLHLNKSPLPFMVIHFDVWDPSKVTTLSGSCWFVTLVDNYTRMTWLNLMTSKNKLICYFRGSIKWLKLSTTHRFKFSTVTMVENIRE